MTKFIAALIAVSVMTAAAAPAFAGSPSLKTDKQIQKFWSDEVKV